MTTSEKYIKETGSSITPYEIGFLISTVQGDGTLQNYYISEVVFNKKNIDFPENVIKMVRKLPHSNRYKGTIRLEKNGNKCFIEDVSLYNLCAYYGLTNTMNKQVITDKIKNECFEFKCGFVAGAFSTDGGFRKGKRGELSISQSDLIKEKFKNKVGWLRFIKEILEEAGVKCSDLFIDKKTNGFAKNTNHCMLYIFTPTGSKSIINFQKYFKLYHKEKQDVVDRMALRAQKNVEKVDEARIIKKFITDNNVTYKQAAEKFNKTMSYINHVKNNRSWSMELIGKKPNAYKTGKKRNKLTELKVKVIKSLLKQNRLQGQEIARIFGVAKETIYGIKHGRTWKHVII